ncbi:hypothetical protein [Streptomyces sp. NPDC127098]|uniref:hypothetical protein n=1 Tax=Streptomyces sp. NPDC127098 TaxID=3347137 RepID=UPI00364FFE84
MTFDMAYDDDGMCAGGDFDLVWSQMLASWQPHVARLGYVRAAFETLGHGLFPDSETPAAALDEAEQQLAGSRIQLPLHSHEVVKHLATHSQGEALDAGTLAAGGAYALKIHEETVHGLAEVPQPSQGDGWAEFLPAGHGDVCASKEASAILLLGVQVLLAAAVDSGQLVVLDDHKYLCDGMWVPTVPGHHRWMDEEIPYGEYLSVLHLEHGDPPDLLEGEEEEEEEHIAPLPLQRERGHR